VPGLPSIASEALGVAELFLKRQHDIARRMLALLDQAGCLERLRARRIGEDSSAPLH